MAFKPLVTVENITLHRPMRSVFHTLFDLDFDISRADTEDSQVKRFFFLSWNQQNGNISLSMGKPLSQKCMFLCIYSYSQWGILFYTHVITLKIVFQPTGKIGIDPLKNRDWTSWSGVTLNQQKVQIQKVTVSFLRWDKLLWIIQNCLQWKSLILLLP